MKKFKSILGSVITATLLATSVTASAIPLSISITGTGDFAGIAYSGSTSSTALSSGFQYASNGTSFSMDTSYLSPYSSPIPFLSSSFFADNTLGTSTGTITIMATAQGYTGLTALSPNTVSSHFGGFNTGADSTAQAWIDNANGLFTMPAVYTTGVQGPFSSASYSDDQSTSFISANPFSITQRIVLNVAAGGNVSGGFTTKVPEPGTLALVGLGLLAAGALRRKK